MILAEAMANCPTGAAEYRDRVPFLDAGEFSAEPAVGKISLIRIAWSSLISSGSLTRQLDEIEVAEARALFCLRTVEAAGRLRPAEEGGSRPFSSGIGVVALGVLAATAQVPQPMVEGMITLYQPAQNCVRLENGRALATSRMIWRVARLPSIDCGARD
jgi:hypothetical protein